MATLVSRNTIKLAADASAVNDYYVGYSIVLTRLDSVTGRENIQTHRIAAYNGSTKVATIDGIWDIGYTPAVGDSYEIIPNYPDSRVSINPAIQSLDYITSIRYGRGLNAKKDLVLDTWLNSARICDVRSDVTLETSGTISGAAVGDIFRYPAAGNIIWQGTIAELKGNYVRFTDIIGKLTSKWSNWKNYSVGELVHQGNRLYKVTIAGIKSAEPVHTSGTINGLELVTALTINKVSGAGSLNTISTVIDGNPIRDIDSKGTKTSGYTLYDSDGVYYWRHLGWNSYGQREVTRHQCNITIDTSLPLFDNMNSLLEHFGGILRYNEGKYILEVEEAEGQIANSEDEPRNITDDHIIGRIRISDEGVRSAFNSLTAAYSDPANKFEARNISFFNSEYLKADRNVPKKGNVSIPGITNYYNARILADKYLNKSRYGLTINFNMEPRGVLLLPGKVIQLQYSRYGWSNKKFRISNLTHNNDCTVDIVAEEYDDSFYVISNIKKQPASGLGGESTLTTISGPSGLVVTGIDSNNESIGGVELKWQNSNAVNTSNVTTEIFASYSPNLYITVSSIASSSIFTTTENHGLKVGEVVTSKSGFNGLEEDKSYYVKSTPQANTFTLSESKEGIMLNSFEDGTNLGLVLLTANIIGLVAPPENTYIDVVPSSDQDNRIEKFYWIRHKITQE